MCLTGLFLRSFGTLGTVLRATLSAVFDAAGVESAAHDVVTHTGEVLDTSATDKHDRVLLQVVTFTGDTTAWPSAATLSDRKSVV